jgi:hypothetical protein
MAEEHEQIAQTIERRQQAKAPPGRKTLRATTRSGQHSGATDQEKAPSDPGPVDSGGAATLAEALGRLPLALDHAAAYCKRTQIRMNLGGATMSMIMTPTRLTRGP